MSLRVIVFQMLVFVFVLGVGCGCFASLRIGENVYGRVSESRGAFKLSCV